MAEGIVVIFDFDKTIIDCDSDNWVVDQLGATELFDQLIPTMPWNPLMDMMMTKLHSQGKSIGDIEAALKRAPIHPRVLSAIQSACTLGCDLKIVSDANLFFIETILEHHGLRGCFSEIFTNPGLVDAEGKLRILPFHDCSAAPHGCGLCPPNMCKGLVMEKIDQATASAYGRRLIYLGDGAGDFCPTLKLTAKDYVMPRKGFPVWDLICANSDRVKAEVREWVNGEDMERVLIRLVASILNQRILHSDGGARSVAGDCKLLTVQPHDGHLPHSLPVPH